MRMVSVSNMAEDGSVIAEAWVVEDEVAARIVAELGAPQMEQLVGSDTARKAAELAAEAVSVFNDGTSQEYR